MTSRTERLTRLTQMVYLLENLPIRLPAVTEFTLEVWSENNGRTVDAIGAAMQDPVFVEQGLGSIHVTDDDGSPTGMAHPSFRDSHAFPAVERFFGLSEAQSHQLFAAGSYWEGAGAMPVARRIRNFLAQTYGHHMPLYMWPSYVAEKVAA